MAPVTQKTHAIEIVKTFVTEARPHQPGMSPGDDSQEQEETGRILQQSTEVVSARKLINTSVYMCKHLRSSDLKRHQNSGLCSEPFHHGLALV
jgi:hypothetical protein